jgi:hypothetical protein
LHVKYNVLFILWYLSVLCEAADQISAAVKYTTAHLQIGWQKSRSDIRSSEIDDSVSAELLVNINR